MEVKQEITTPVPCCSSKLDISIKPEDVEMKTEENQEIEIPSIVDSITQDQIDTFQPFHERYFQKKYCTSFTKPEDSSNLDTCIRVHTNKVCVIYLSEKHSIVTNHQRIKKLNFQVSKKVNRLQNSMSGKGKRGAQLLKPDSILCFIETTDGVKYPVHAGICGKLLEINSRLKEDPNLLVDDLNEGFLAIILPDLKKHEDNLKSLKIKDEYLL